MASSVTIDRNGPVAVLTLDDPDRRNVLSAAMVSEIALAMDDLEADPAIRALVVTGAGTTFCAGAELATLEQAADGDFGLIRGVYGGFLRILNSPLVTIGAINGAAVGAGFNLALACDVRVAAETARFVCRFAELRIFPGGGHGWLLSRAVGHQQAALALLLGQTWNADQAYRVGLVADVVDRAKVVDTATGLGAGLGDMEAEYVRRLVRWLRRAPLVTDHDGALEAEAVQQEWSTRRPAFLRGLADIKASVGQRNAKPAVDGAGAPTPRDGRRGS